jgi:hypothetical protein
VSFANPSFTDIASTTIENRAPEVADNVTKNNALLYCIEKDGNLGLVDELTGGSQILQPLAFAQNPNGQFYSGLDTLATGAADVISAAAYPIKQLACAVVTSGLEKLQNSGAQALIKLVAARVKVAESTMRNLVSQSLYSDGTGFGGKQITGMASAVSATPTSGIYGGIDPNVFSFWANAYTSAAAATSSNIQGFMNTMYLSLVRGTDHPNLIVADNTMYGVFLASCQLLQRFMKSDMADLGFEALKYMGSNVVLDGGIGGFCDAKTMFFLNTKYIHWRPHKDRNFTSLEGRRPVNQDAEIAFEALAANLTVSGREFHGRLVTA